MSSYTLMVCPHDTVHNASAWYRLLAYLGTRSGIEVHFDLALDFGDFYARLDSADLVFANPSDSLRLIDRGFTPVVRPAEHYDEAVLVMGPNRDPLPIHALHNATIATVERTAPTQLALYDLRRQSVTPAGFTHCDSWLSVVRSVWNGDAPFGIIYRDAYDDLSPQSQAMVQIVARTDTRKLFHLMCASPRMIREAPELLKQLVGMNGDPEGREILSELGFTKWQTVTADDLQAMRAILN